MPLVSSTLQPPHKNEKRVALLTHTRFYPNNQTNFASCYCNLRIYSPSFLRSGYPVIF